MFDFYTTEKPENLNPMTFSVSIEMVYWAFKLFKENISKSNSWNWVNYVTDFVNQVTQLLLT